MIALALFTDACRPGPSESQPPTLVESGKTTAGVDLQIADDETYKRPVSWSSTQPLRDDATLLAGVGAGAASRPGISIAWRNASQIEEVEVKVQNLGTDAAEGRLFVDITDETGQLLLHLEPPDDQKLFVCPLRIEVARMDVSFECKQAVS